MDEHMLQMLKVDNVYIHETQIDSQFEQYVSGEIIIWNKNQGKFFEWRADDIQVSPKDNDWTLLPNTAVSYDKKSKKVSSVIKKKIIINFELNDLKCFKISKPNQGWPCIIFTLKCGTTYPALYFHTQGSSLVVAEMHKHLLVHKSSQDDRLYVVREPDPQHLSKSFDELDLFGKDQAGDIISRFFADPYTATLGGFTKVTKFLQDALLVPPIQDFYIQGDDRPSMDGDLINEKTMGGLAISTDGEDDFAVITSTKRQLPEKQDVIRSSPVTMEKWISLMDSHGCIKNPLEARELIFRGGIEPNARPEIWKFLLGYYRWNSSHRNRLDLRKQKIEDYFRMKLQWKTISIDQQVRFSELKDRKSLIEKDVMRTDRNHKFFEGSSNQNLVILNDILLTHCMYDFDLGYVQGMSDLLAPILVVMGEEVDAFWCFVGFIKMIGRNFEKDQQAMKCQLLQLQTLLNFIDPQLANYLESHNSINMYFCFRWLLVLFKREFSFPEIMRLWEVIWTGQPCINFHLLICLSILDSAKVTLIENNFDFNEILKYINDLSGNINAEEILCSTEAMYNQLRDCLDLTDEVDRILGISVPHYCARPFQPFNPFEARPIYSSSPQSSDVFLPTSSTLAANDSGSSESIEVLIERC